VDEISLDRLPRITPVPRRFLSTAHGRGTTPEYEKIFKG
jgi:hypothetical protein